MKVEVMTDKSSYSFVLNKCNVLELLLL